MPTVNELFSDTIDKTLVIDSDLRTINIPSSITNIGVESDDDVTRLYFRMPRYYNDTDLSEFVTRINYHNAKSEPDVYEVTDASVEGDYICFSWLVGRFAVMYKGTVKFIVCLKKFHSDGTVDKEFNTTTAFLPVLEGLETEEAVVEAYPDAIAAAAYEAILLAIDSDLKGEPGYTPVKGTDYYTPDERDEFVEEVVNTAKGVYANAYKQTVSGEVIRVDDVSPLEHTIGVAVKSKNMCPMSVFDVMHPNGSITEYDSATHTITLLSDSPGSQGHYVSPVKNLIVGETYTMSFDIKGTPGKKVKCGWDKKNIQVTLTDEYVRYSSTLVATHNAEAIIFYNKATVDGGLSAGEYMQFDNVQVVRGEETEYSEYVDPSTVTLTKYGVNMMPYPHDATTNTSNGITFTDNGDGSVKVNGTASSNAQYNLIFSNALYLKAGTYVLSGCPANGGARVYRITIKTTDDTPVYHHDIGEGIVFTLDEDKSIYVYILIYKDTTVNNLVFRPQLEVGDIATEFKTYISETYTPSTNGVVENVYSVSPTMTLYTDTPNTIIEAEYSRDTNALIGDISAALDILISTQEATIAKLDNMVGGGS